MWRTHLGGSGRGGAHRIWRLGGEESVLERLGNAENPFGESVEIGRCSQDMAFPQRRGSANGGRW
jgi:hypothetical protein